MATKTEEMPVTQRGAGNPLQDIEDRLRRKREAVTVDGTESFPPPGMIKPDLSVVSVEEAQKAVDEGQGKTASKS